MYYDSDSLEELSAELGFRTSRPSPDVLEIALLEGVTLEFHNLRDDEDTAAGFSGMQSHFHGNLMLTSGDETYVELDELDIVDRIKSGTVLIAERYLNGTLKNRWLVHKDEKVDVEYIEPGEEIRFRRLA